MSDYMQGVTSPTVLIVSVVPQGKGEQVVNAARTAHSAGGFVMYGQGTASEKIWERLNITKHREVIICVSLFHRLDSVMTAIAKCFDQKKKNNGITFVISIEKYLGKGIMQHIIKKARRAHPLNVNSEDLSVLDSDEAQVIKKKVEDMMRQFSAEKQKAQDACDSELIVIRMAKGFAYEIMSCARKAGAIGGTILHGRTPLDSNDVKFFNITIDPEGEMLFMLVPKEISGDVLDAVATQYGPLTPAHAFGFVLPVIKTMQMSKVPEKN